MEKGKERREQGGAIANAIHVTVKDNVLWEVGSKREREINLYEDKWVGNEALKDKFQRLFSICSCRKPKLRQGGD